MEDCCIVLTTIDSKDNAKKIAKCLIEKQLCACVNIISDISSIYRWEGKIVEDNEYLLVIKTKKSLYFKVEESIKNNHSYDLPEIISVPVENGYKDYLNWICENTNLC